MTSEKELFDLAKQYVMLSDELQKEKLLEYESDEIKESLEKIRNTVLNKGYDINKFVEYQEMYKSMTIEGYYKFIKTLN